MLVPLKSSLVGRPAPDIPPGRGEPDGMPWVAMFAGLEVGPIEARKLGDLPLVGPGEGVGLGA